VAQTVVGTPYYMAPEACESKPYTSKSDVWALGVILYELCTLKKPFAADNLLGLVFKIVSDKHDPIPETLPYTRELR
jgi:NIMA (never in mitosis gene a)-related kinase